jgi:hypothetical protein
VSQIEDSVGEEERREQGPQTMVKPRQLDERVEEDRGGEGEPGEEGGFLSDMASKIGAAMAGGDVRSGEDGGTVNATKASSSDEEAAKEGPWRWQNLPEVHVQLACSLAGLR